VSMTYDSTALAPSTMTSRREFGRGVKEKLCFIAFDYDAVLKSTAESSDKKQTHMLSDGNVFTVSAERFRCTSVFPANFIGIQASGVHDTSFHNIMKCDVDIRCQVAPPCSKSLVSA